MGPYDRQEGRHQRFQIEFLSKARKIRVGEITRLQFKVTDPGMGHPMNGLDIRTLTFLFPGIWQKRDWAEFIGDGIYEITFSLPRSGTYYVFFECPSMGIRYNQLPHLVLAGNEGRSEF